MSLYLGQSGNVADLIASIIPENEILEVIDRLMEPQIGTIKLAINAHAAFDNLQIPMAQDITTSTAAAYFKNGWAYTNGAYIAKKFFPKAYEILKSAGMQYDANRVKLPNLYGFLYAASTNSSNTINGRTVAFHQDAQNYGSPNHIHDFNFTQTTDTPTLIRNATWIWSTKNAGAGFHNENPVTYTDSRGNRYIIPAKTSSAHGGHHSVRLARFIVWDIPVNVNSTTTSSIDVTTGNEIPRSYRTVENTELRPRHVIVNSMIYIGRPKI